MAGHDLTPKQQAFVAEYLVDLNATQAAIRAGYSVKTAYSQAHELLKKPEVGEALQAAFAERAERVGLTQDAVVERLMWIAFGDLRDLATWDEDGEVRVTPSDALDDRAAAALKEISQTKRVIPQKGADPIEVRELAVKSYDRMKALELLGKHLGMWREKVDVNVSGGLTLSALARMVEPDDGDGTAEIEG